jgi:murein DD-endopeptidase MepM/ murein hydrolase activator NlpD
MPHQAAARSIPAHSSRPALGLLLAAFLLLTAIVPSGATEAGSAADGSREDPKVDLDRTRDRIDEVAAELDLLQQSDMQLQVHLDELTVRIAELAQEVDERRLHAESAARRADALAEAAGEAEDRVDAQQAELERRAVSAYIGAGGTDLSAILGSEDYNELHERTTLVRQVAEHDRAVLRRLVASRAELDADQRAAEQSRADADRLAEEAERALADLEATRNDQAAVERALDARIAEFQSEVDALAAEEDALVRLIAARTQPPPSPPTTAILAPPSTVEADPEPTTTEPDPSEPTTTAATSVTSTTVATTATTATTAPPTTVAGSPTLRWPVAGPVTSPFGERWGRMHNGIDIGVSTGTPIGAAAAGTVVMADWFGGYGNCVIVDHGGGWVTLYAHQSRIDVDEGDSVAAGQTVGLVGSTGHSTGPHLHFEVRIGGTPNDPQLYLP